MVKAVQAEDAVSGHFDGLLKSRVAAEVSQQHVITSPQPDTCNCLLDVYKNCSMAKQQLLAHSRVSSDPHSAGMTTCNPTGAVDLAIAWSALLLP
jgi:hypothetical protein